MGIVTAGDDARRAFQLQNVGVPLDLRGVKLPFLGSMSLSDADLSESTIEGTGESDFLRANLRGAHLGGTYDSTFIGADLTGASLQFAMFVWTDFRDVSLRDADLSHAALVGCGLEGADLTGATMDWTTIADTDLSGCKGLGALAAMQDVKIDVRTLELTLRGLGGQFTPEIRAFFAAADVPEAPG